MTDRDDRNTNAMYMHAPAEMMTTAIGLTINVACALVAERQARTLITLVRDETLCRRAASLILNHLLRSMVDRTDPTPKQFATLVHAVAALAKEQ